MNKPPSRRRTRYELPDQLRKATRLFVAGLRAGGNDAGAIRAEIRRGFDAALVADRLRTRQFRTDRGPELFVSTDGVFAFIFGQAWVDRGDQHAQETWWEVVRAEMEEAISAPPPA